MSFNSATLEDMSRAEQFHGAVDLDAMFKGAPATAVPWNPAGRRKSVQDYDKELVHNMLRQPPKLEEIDPRDLRATQPMVTRAGVQHYLSNNYLETGETFADQGNAGNRYPVVYSREDGQNLLLSGHHRGAAALLEGRQFAVRKVTGAWGPPRARS